jgi:hypothetical protein
MAGKKPETDRPEPGNIKLDVTIVTGPGKTKHLVIDETGSRELGHGKEPAGTPPIPGGGKAPQILPGEPGTRWVGKGDPPDGPPPVPGGGKSPKKPGGGSTGGGFKLD